MGIDIRDIQLQQAESLTVKEDAPKRFPAKLASVDGSVIVNNKPNHVYFREFGSEEAAIGMAINYITKKQAGLAVYIEEHPSAKGVLTVTGLYTDDSSPSTTENMSSFAIGSHADSHEYESETNFGDDVTRIFLPAIQPFKLTGVNLTYVVQPLVFTYRSIRYLFPGYTDTITASTAGKVRYVAVYLNLATNIVGIAEGAEVINNFVIPIPLPTIPASGILLSGYLKVDDSEVVSWVDARTILNFDQYNLTPRNVGDILIAEQENEFVSRRPVTDRFGDIVTDSDGIIITV